MFGRGTFGAFACALLSALSLLSAPVASAAVEANVAITDDRLEPAVTVVPMGADVIWTNKGNAIHGVGGDGFASPTLMPGQTFTQRFDRPGSYDYADTANPDMTGTVLVVAGAAHPKRKSGSDTNRFSGTLKLNLSETYKFYDGRWRSVVGACNAQVGAGSRLVSMTIRFKNVKYARAGSIEVLSGSGVGRFARLTERMTSKIADGVSGPFTPLCQDGVTENEFNAVHEANCERNLTGTRVRGRLSWSRTIRSGRLQFMAESSASNDACGPHFIGGLALTNVDPNALPFSVTATSNMWDSVSTDPLTRAEVTRLRGGRRLKVRRSLALNFTTDCCMGFNPRTTDPIGVWVRTGVVMKTSGDVTLTLRPR